MMNLQLNMEILDLFMDLNGGNGEHQKEKPSIN